MISLRTARLLGALAFLSSEAVLLLFALKTLPWLLISVVATAPSEDVVRLEEARARARVIGRGWRGMVFPETAFSFPMA